ncbi:MAG: DUF4124 domain-containing protein [Proteobacteria bacterium]|nr:DUF4124 domain-containing protein [Pseudomonadota bacterium]
MSKTTIFILSTFFFLLSFSAQSAVYKWVDQNGKVTYSNTPPPSQAKILEESTEVVESNYSKAARIERKRIDREIEYQRKKEAEQLELLQQQQELVLQSEAEQIVTKQQPRYRLSLRRQIRKEDKILTDALSKVKKGCRKQTKRISKKRECIKHNTNYYTRKIEFLRENPIDYFAEKRVAEANNRIARQKRKQSGSSVAITEESGPPNIIYTTSGETLNRAAGGYVGSDDTFYTDAAGNGIINTKTGEYSPIY